MEVKAITTENIEKILQCGERLDILQERSSLLENSTGSFKFQSKRLQASASPHRSSHLDCNYCCYCHGTEEMILVCNLIL